MQGPCSGPALLCPQGPAHPTASPQPISTSSPSPARAVVEEGWVLPQLTMMRLATSQVHTRSTTITHSVSHAVNSKGDPWSNHQPALGTGLLPCPKKPLMLKQALMYLVFPATWRQPVTLCKVAPSRIVKHRGLGEQHAQSCEIPCHKHARWDLVPSSRHGKT